MDNVAGAILAALLVAAGLAAWAWWSWERWKFREDGRRWEDEDLEA